MKISVSSYKFDSKKITTKIVQYPLNILKEKKEKDRWKENFFMCFNRESNDCTVKYFTRIISRILGLRSVKGEIIIL